MAIDYQRRRIVTLAGQGMLASPFFAAAVTPALAASHSPDSVPRVIGCGVRSKGQYEAVIADIFGQPIHRLPLPKRGHGVAVSPHKSECVVFARRPGSYAMVVDYQQGHNLKMIVASRDRHFYGHGGYSPDGHWLYVSEGDSGSSKGVIGVYDATEDYQKVDEWHGFGIGPHELRVLATGDVAVAVGGVHTQGRQPLNIPSMRPNLSYLSAKGELLDQVALQQHKNSIRHLATTPDGQVVIGQQYRGSEDESVPLIALHQRGQPLSYLHAEPEEWAHFRHYIASIAVSEDFIVATSPRGSCYGVWEAKSKDLLSINRLSDASGVVEDHGRFFVSSGSGKVVKINCDLSRKNYRSNIQWDNHWSAITTLRQREI